jgi:hypothetical protein
MHVWHTKNQSVRHTHKYTQKNSGRMERQRKDRASYKTATTKNNSFCPPFWYGTTKAHTHYVSFLILLLLSFFFSLYIVSFFFCIPLSLYGTTNIFLEEQDGKNDKHKKAIIENQRLMYETQCIIHESFFFR